MLVKVTKKDIANGIPGRPSSCPVALALQRRYNTYITVFGCYARLDTGFGVTSNMDLPKEVTKFIAAFDAHKPVKPFSFEIKL